MLSTDLINAENNLKIRRKRKKEILSDLQSTHNNRMTNALKLATAFPLMGVSGYAGIGAANLTTATADSIANSVKRRSLKTNKMLRSINLQLQFEWQEQ